MSLKHSITIVIPSKNEGITLFKCLESISKQAGILGTKVIIADSSTEPFSKNCVNLAKYIFTKLDIEVVEGGLPAQARYNGAKNVNTYRVLFMDADTELIDPETLTNLLFTKFKNLITIKIVTDWHWNIIYELFFLLQKFLLFNKIPFATGCFQMFKTKEYKKIGEYNPEDKFAEDFSISRKVDYNSFALVNKFTIYTSPRRFKNGGLKKLIKLMIHVFLNRNNKNTYNNDYNYFK
jgi:glycosyltransferase involved in cell wall biosynthesis